MKRGGFIARKEPLHTVTFASIDEKGKWSFPKMKRTPLARIGAKKKGELHGRKKCCDAVRARCDGMCEAKLDGCQRRMHHTHEILARSQGGSPTDPANCLGVCFACHCWITENMNAAREMGLAK